MFATRLKSALALVVLASATTAVLPSNGADAASAAPKVTLSAPTFTSYESGFVEDYNEWIAHFTVHWAVTAPAGVCSQTFTFSSYETQGEPGETVTLAKTARSYADVMDYLDYDRGGYTAFVQVKDCDGTTATSNVVHAVILPGENDDSGLSYGGAWSISHCSCFSGGTTHWTTAKNASATFRTAEPIGAEGVDVALIMSKAKNRGSAAVYVDGVKKATVNTYSKTAINRQVVYQILLAGTASHTVKIVNLATKGHPRIDLDATINGAADSTPQ